MNLFPSRLHVGQFLFLPRRQYLEQSSKHCFALAQRAEQHDVPPWLQDGALNH